MHVDGFSTFLMTVLLSMGGSWFLQNNLSNELKGQLMNHITEHSKEITEHAKELFELRTKVNAQAVEINELREKTKEQNKKIIDHNNIIIELKSRINLFEKYFKYMDEAKSPYKEKKTTETVTRVPSSQFEVGPQVRGCDGPPGHKGQKGAEGINGSPGSKGESGPPGPKGDSAKGGTVYVRWGHNSCPDSGAKLVYEGRAGGSHYDHRGGGGNPQCLPIHPEYHNKASGSNNHGYMFGAEYQETNGLVAPSHDNDVPCAVCHVPTRGTVFMMPAKYTCPTGWTREYFGYLMSGYHGHHRTEFSCVDNSLTPVVGSSHNHDGFLFYTVEGICGSLPCPHYINNKELSCAVCTK